MNLTGISRVAVLCLAGFAVPAAAMAPEWSIPPRLRPEAVATFVAVSSVGAGAPTRSLPPRLRPGFQKPSTVAVANQTAPSTPVTAVSGEGRLCRDNQIRGAQLAPIQGQLSGCGIAAPVRVSSIAGVVFSPAAVMDCDTARAAREWIEDTAVPAWGRLGGGLRGVAVAGSYSCQAANGGSAARLSEHARGRAFDVSAFTLQNGISVSVAQGWRDDLAGQVLRKIASGGCDAFPTVLGPDDDRFHQSHLQFDMGRSRGTC